MKSAEELFNGSRTYSNGIDVYIDVDDVKEILIRHDNEIKAKIDEMIGEYKKDQKELINYGNDGIIIDYQIIALTELKQFIEGIK